MLIFEEMNMFRMQAIKRGTYKKSPHFFPCRLPWLHSFSPFSFQRKAVSGTQENKDLEKSQEGAVIAGRGRRVGAK
jgi:hypothetical protein